MVLLSYCSLPAVHAAFESLAAETDSDREVLGSSTLQAVIDAFDTVVDAQAQVQASDTPTIHLSHPIYLKFLTDFHCFAGGGTVCRGEERVFVASSRNLRGLCRAMYPFLEQKVCLHNL